MGTRFNEVYADNFSAAAINAAASETFGADSGSVVKHDRYGSANSLILTSTADENFRIDLDGLSSRSLGILFAKGALVIKPEDGIFFNSIKLVNISATNSSADEVKVRIARAVEV